MELKGRVDLWVLCEFIFLKRQVARFQGKEEKGKDAGNTRQRSRKEQQCST